MELEFQTVLPLIAGAWLVYALVLSVYRLYYSPIANIPGPKLAALTQYYEFYYDIILGGQYTFKIVQLHRQYGSVVRISPWEVHVCEHHFFSDLYSNSTRRREKWLFWAKQFGAPDSALATVDHNHHKMRRAALNPFFSTQSVRALQPVIQERVDTVLAALLRYTDANGAKPVNLMYPFSAFTNDVINEYAFARSDHLSRSAETGRSIAYQITVVEKSDFGADVTDSLLMGTHMGPLIKHASWILTFVNMLPESLSARCVPGWSGFLKMKNAILEQIISIKRTENTSKWQVDVSHATIFHELISSKHLPTVEKSPHRLAQEGQILVQGGTLTTSWVLSLAVFHLLSNPEMLSRLRDELCTAMPSPDETPALADLECLSYLRAVVKEAFRYGLGTSGRLPRVAPDEALFCRDGVSGREWRLPPGSVVSMSPYMTVMDDKLFPEPLSFRPQRWLGDGERMDRYLVIFGHGTRSCLGMALANAEVYLVLAKLFRTWGDVSDRRDGDVGALKVFETTLSDCEMAADYFIPIPYKGSKGIRVSLQTY